MVLSKHRHSRNRVIARNVNSARDILSFGNRHGQLLVMISPNNDAMRLFAGKRILVFEDGFLLSEEAKFRLANAGAVILGPATTASQALDYLECEAIDAVVMDVALEPEAVLSLISEPERGAVPFIFALSDNPRPDGQRFAGFIFSARNNDLSTIAEAMWSSNSPSKSIDHCFSFKCF